MNKFQKTLGGLTLVTGIALFGIQNYDEIGRTLQKTTNYVGRNVNKVSDSIFTADAKFNDYKGEWEPYSFHGEDKNMYNVGLRCVKKLGANGEHWRNQIEDYPKNKGINWTRLQHGDSFWVPKECDCSVRYKK